MAEVTPQAAVPEAASTNASLDNASLDNASLERGKRKTRVGTVSSDKMDKTLVVEVNTLKPHPLYGRTVRQTAKFKAHDETNEGHIGDTVEIMECRPMSREKRWRLVRIVERAK